MQKNFNRALRAAATMAVLMSTSGTAWASTPLPAGLPPCLSGPPGQVWQPGDPYDGYPMPRPGTPGGGPAQSQVTSPDGMTTIVQTGHSLFAESDPWDNPTNMLPTVYHDVYDSLCNLVPNTLSSSPEHPYNLHDEPIVSTIDKSSPYTDLEAIINSFRRAGNTGYGGHDGDDDRGNSDRRIRIDPAKVQFALDILEGNPIPNRNYSGMPVLHYNGPDKQKTVDPVTKNVNIHIIYYRSHIEADTSLLDTMGVLDDEWTITYTVDSLDKGADDFSPSTMTFDDPNAFGGLASGANSMKPLIMQDQTFFPQQEGKRYVYTIRQSPGRFFNGIYTWGWRVHPGRVQFMENQNKTALGHNLLQWEQLSFGEHPMASRENQLAAIGKIGNLAPEKRMWNAFNALRDNNIVGGPVAAALVKEIEQAFDDWDHRGRLPRGVQPDPNADITLFYANNTIYANVKGYTDPNAHLEYTQWVTRTQGNKANIKIINGDYFDRGYMSVDFGGMRGWENTFHNTVPVGGDGPWFTFGREHWFPNVFPVLIPAATASNATAPVQISARALEHHPGREFRMAEMDPDGDSLHHYRRAVPSIPTANGDVLTEHSIESNWNFDPSRRLRFYQFDPLHHDVAVFSMH